MAEHPDHVEGWDGSLEDLASAMGRMRYDCLAKLLGLLRGEIQEQSIADRKRGRKVLSARLGATALNLLTVEQDVNMAWRICEPHMTTEAS